MDTQLPPGDSNLYTLPLAVNGVRHHSLQSVAAPAAVPTSTRTQGHSSFLSLLSIDPSSVAAPADVSSAALTCCGAGRRVHQSKHNGIAPLCPSLLLNRAMRTSTSTPRRSPTARSEATLLRTERLCCSRHALTLHGGFYVGVSPCML